MSAMTDHIELYRSGLRRKKWRWRYVAANGNILADSGQGYVRREDALHGATVVTGRTFPFGRKTILISDRPASTLRVVEVDR